MLFICQLKKKRFKEKKSWCAQFGVVLLNVWQHITLSTPFIGGIQRKHVLMVYNIYMFMNVFVNYNSSCGQS